MSKRSLVEIPLHEFQTQIEILETLRKRGALQIGIPKETCLQEKRIGLSPEAVSVLVSNGHRVLIQHGAGEGARYSDRDYSEAGAELTSDVRAVFASNIVLKVEPPSAEEIEYLKPKNLLISALQLGARDRDYFKKLMDKRITALSFERLVDDDGVLPVVRSMSEIAGNTAILIAAELLSNAREGKGYMLGGVSGVPPTEVVIIGAGTVGTFAARTAMGLGAVVKVFDRSLSRLRRLQSLLREPVYTCMIQEQLLAKALQRCDVAIGAARSDNGRTPNLVSEAMVMRMREGSVIVDVSIDQGGCFETSELTTHEQPTFVKHGVVHYCVSNIPSRVSRTASFSLSNVLGQLLLDIGECGGVEEVLRRRPGVRAGLYLYNGILTSPVLGNHFDLPFSESDLLFQ